MTSIGYGAFSKCSGLTSVTIGSSVTFIGGSAFEGCSGLTSITIGSGITGINNSAFAKCPELTDVTCMTKSVPATSSDAFADSYIEYATLHVPETAIEAYKATAPWSSFKSFKKIVMPAHTIAYIVDGEEYMSYEIEEGETITPEPAPTKEGYTFSGWSEIPETMPAHDVTVKGIFGINKYKLIYTVDGEVYKSYEVEYGATITLEAAPAKEGYTFSGWSDIPKTMPAHDVIVLGSFYKKGDANSDNTVNAADIVEVVNYIMENPSEKFNKTASDMNNDGVVNDADIKEIVKIIMESE